VNAIAPVAVLLAAFATAAAKSPAEAAAGKPAAKPVAKAAGKPAKPRVLVTISKETTYITQPLRPDGYPDYVAALNQLTSKGVTPENNAAMLLWQAVGSAGVPQVIRERFFKMLGIPVPPERGNYYATLQEHMRKTGLAPKPGEVEPGDEGFDQAVKQLDEAMKRPWTSKEFPLLAGWLAANEKPLALVVEATKRPRLYDPLVAAGESGMVIDVLLPGSQNQRHLARALEARAMLRLGQGKAEAAWADLLACHRLARLSAQGPVLVQALVGLAIDGMACQGDQALLQHGRLSAGQLRAMRADLDRLAPMPKMVDKLDPGERFMFLDAVAAIAREGIDKLSRLDGGGSEPSKVIKALMKQAARVMIDWDVILRMGNTWYDRLAAAYRKPTRAERKEAFVGINKDIERMIQEGKDMKSLAPSFVGNPRRTLSKQIGRIFVCLLLPAVSAARDAQDRGDMQFQVTKLGFALAAYRADQGAYPARLAELVPKYISTVPDDLCSAGPLHYARERDGYLLYSVGLNGKDDGGRGYADRDKSGDWSKDWDDLSVRVTAEEQQTQPHKVKR
jgi:hypothetical protein